MIGGIGNSMILGNFDSTFAAHPEMALYIPLVGGTGGNVGTQSSALIVQGLANSSLDAQNTWKQNSKGICSGRNQCYYYFYAGIYL